MIFRRRFSDLIRRQLDLFESDQAELLRRCEEAERAYDRAGRPDAEEHYGDYADLVDEGAEALADVRDAYADTLTEDAAAEYEQAFNRAVVKRFRRFASHLDD